MFLAHFARLKPQLPGEFVKVVDEFCSQLANVTMDEKKNLPFSQLCYHNNMKLVRDFIVYVTVMNATQDMEFPN